MTNQPETPGGTSGTPAQPARGQSIKSEGFDIDVSKLSSEETEALRQKLRDFSAGLRTDFAQAELRGCHSSHTDNDGWI